MALPTMSESCPLVEWRTRLSGHQPQFKGKADRSTTWLPLVDDYCDVVRDRWVYVLLRLVGLDDYVERLTIHDLDVDVLELDLVEPPQQ